MIIKLAYESGCGDLLKDQLSKSLKTKESDFYNFKVIAYDEGHYKSKKDALQLKASCGARLLPFCAIYNDDKEIIKAFYSEVGDCTLNNILDFINNEVI